MKKQFLDLESQNFLSALGQHLDADSKQMLAQGQLVIEDADFYVRKEVTALGGSNDLIARSESEKVGTRNIDRATLPALQNLILQGIQVAYGTHATETDSALISYSTKVPGTPDTALMNGEIVIEQDDKPLISIPVDRFFTGADSDEPKGVKDVVWLKNWRLIKSERPFFIKLKTAEGQSIDGTAKHHLEVRLLGSKTRKR